MPESGTYVTGKSQGERVGRVVSPGGYYNRDPNDEDG